MPDAIAPGTYPEPSPASAAGSPPIDGAAAPTARHEATRLNELTPQQWKSGIAAWLGWLFDGLDMHLYTLVAAPFVASLLLAETSSADVKQKSAFIQAAFLVGWALGGGFFGRLGDLVGRSRALSLTILTYAAFTGLSFFVHTWWQLMICRFLAALGIGGEWAVGSALLSETWPSRWRAWIAAVLQTGVNVGVLLACATVYLLTTDGAFKFVHSVIPSVEPNYYLRTVFLVGVLPAVLVFWIRRHVPEPAEWTAAQARTSDAAKPGLADLFRGDVRRITLLTIGVCACALTGWWAFMFWHLQHLQSLVPDWTAGDRARLGSVVFSSVILVSILGNFFVAWVARLLGYRNSIALMCLMFAIAITGAYYKERTYLELIPWLMFVGFCSGIFGLFTMYLPPLFPTLLRTTGAGFSYNVGRIAAAGGTVAFAMGLQVGGFRHVLLCVSLLFIPAGLFALRMPNLRDPVTVR